MILYGFALWNMLNALLRFSYGFRRFSSVFVGFARAAQPHLRLWQADRSWVRRAVVPLDSASTTGRPIAPSSRAARLCLYHWQAEDNVGTFSLIQKCIKWVLRNIGNTYVVDDLWWALVAHLLNLFFFPPRPTSQSWHGFHSPFPSDYNVGPEMSSDR